MELFKVIGFSDDWCDGCVGGSNSREEEQGDVCDLEPVTHFAEGHDACRC